MNHAEARGSALTEEEHWAEMAFVAEGEQELAWSPVRVEGADDKTRRDRRAVQAYQAEWAIGYRYAMDMIEHLRDYSDPRDVESGMRLAQVVEAIVKGGQFGSVERAFFYSLGAFIGTGCIMPSCDFVAKPYDIVPDPQPPADVS